MIDSTLSNFFGLWDRVTIVCPFLSTEHNQDLWDFCTATGRDAITACSSLSFLFVSLHLLISTLASMASPQCLTYSSCPSGFCLLHCYDTGESWSNGSCSSAAGQQFSFSRLNVQKRKSVQKESWQRGALGRGMRGKEQEEITLPFLHALELLPTCSAFCGTPCPAQHGATSLSTECHLLQGGARNGHPACSSCWELCQWVKECLQVVLEIHMGNYMSMRAAT